MNTFTPFYLISAALAGDSAREAAERTSTLATQLRSLGFAVDNVTGCYKGQTEPSLIVIPWPDYNSAAEADVLRLARVWGQESVLAVDANRQATLLYADGTREPLGAFVPAAESKALKHDAWTERNGRYYVVECAS